jgi:competence protein ComEC
MAVAGAVALGLAWAGLRAEMRLADALPGEWEGRDVAVTGVVAELPQAVEHGVRFAFRVEQAEAPVPARILLAWYDRRGPEAGERPAVHAGERWHLTVRLKRPHGNANPGGFDYEAWLLERSLRATGYVRASPANRRLAEFVPTPVTVVESLRETLRDRLLAALAEGAYPGVVVALAVGEQGAIDPGLWRVFNRTGVQHLFAISGLHVGMVGLLVGGLAMALWRRVPALALRLPAQKAGALAGWLAALAYGAVAGMGVPTQRTVLMLGVAALAILVGRQAASGRVLGLALLAVLLADPWAVLAAGFWLSFGAVAVLVVGGAGRFARVGAWGDFWRSQGAISLALIPALLALFQQFSLAAPLANGVAIPVVSLVVTPLILIYLVLPFPPLVHLADLLLQVLIAGLAWFAELPWAVWQQAAAPWPLVVGAAVGCAWGLLPPGTPGRWIGWAGLLPLLAWAPSRPGPGQWRLTVLDVGHGLAVHVQTARHDLLYDTGPAWSREGNSGLRVVLPFLRAEGVQALDRLVVSHDDIDHAGGAASVLAELPVTAWSSTLAANHPLRAARPPHHPCAAGQGWTWDGVEFRFLHPGPDLPPGASDNARSCVLRIASPRGSALLPADLEAQQEAALVDRAVPGSIASDLLVVPHHGSRSSSSGDLVAAVAPRVVIYPVGYLNRFHHPHPAVWTRWAEAGARAWRTDAGGAIRAEAGSAGLTVSAYRDSRPRYWHGR